MWRWSLAITLWCAAVVPALASSTSVSHPLAGRWTSAPNEIPLSSAFDESVWGPKAKSIRTVDLQIDAAGHGVLKVTTRVVDGRGRTVSASTSVEEARLVVGESRNTIATRVEHDVMVASAVRTYPDDPASKWEIEGLKVQIVTFTDGNGNTLEVRFDTPEGRGSFWETLRRRGKSTRTNTKTE
jgi:hypothetical protein